MIKIKFDSESLGMLQPDIVTDILQRNFKEVIECDDPDFIFCGPFGYDYLNSKAVRIFSTGENIRPDFNLVDYAIGFDYMTFGDRYMRMPLYYLYTADYERAVCKHEFTQGILNEKTDFCNFVYSNKDADTKREDFFSLLNQYKKVNSAGRIRNNTGGLLSKKQDSKYIFQKKHKFSIAFENSSTPGYTTEKILQAFAAQTVPIYWGDPRIGEEFSEASFINCMKYDSFEEVINKVIELDNDDEQYTEYLKAPIFTDTIQEIDYYDRLEKFLVNIFSQQPEKAMRRVNVHRGWYYQEDIRKFHAVEKSSAYTYLLRLKKIK